jgi:hypothetical protein
MNAFENNLKDWFRRAGRKRRAESDPTSDFFWPAKNFREWIWKYFCLKYVEFDIKKVWKNNTQTNF